jgi:hypothetical protein
LKGRVAVKYSHWTEVEEKALEDAGSMGDLAEIALVILERMAKKKKPIVEICGPMSTGGFGNIKDNMELFEAMIDSATEHDLTVFNQVVFQDAMVRLLPKHSEHHYAWDILDIFYRRIFDSGLISEFLFSPNWYTSRGACWELLESLKVCINRRLSGLMASANLASKTPTVCKGSTSFCRHSSRTRTSNPCGNDGASCCIISGRVQYMYTAFRFIFSYIDGKVLYAWQIMKE